MNFSASVLPALTRDALLAATPYSGPREAYTLVAPGPQLHARRARRRGRRSFPGRGRRRSSPVGTSLRSPACCSSGHRRRPGRASDPGRPSLPLKVDLCRHREVGALALLEDLELDGAEAGERGHRDRGVGPPVTVTPADRHRVALRRRAPRGRRCRPAARLPLKAPAAVGAELGDRRVVGEAGQRRAAVRVAMHARHDVGRVSARRRCPRSSRSRSRGARRARRASGSRRWRRRCARRRRCAACSCSMPPADSRLPTGRLPKAVMRSCSLTPNRVSDRRHDGGGVRPGRPGRQMTLHAEQAVGDLAGVRVHSAGR